MARRLRKRAPGAPVVIWTQHVSQGKTIAKFVGKKHIVKIVQKGKQPFSDAAEEIEELAGPRQRRPISDCWLVRDLLRIAAAATATSCAVLKRELNRELERIYRRLFVVSGGS